MALYKLKVSPKQAPSEGYLYNPIEACCTNMDKLLSRASTGRPMYYSIEGNIGVGKSTLWSLIQKDTERVQKALGASVYLLEEPVKVWQDVDGFPFLKTYYSNKEKYAYAFQSYALLTRAKTITKRMEEIVNNSDSRPSILFSERSCFTDSIFAQYYANEGFFNPMEVAVYNRTARLTMALTGLSIGCDSKDSILVPDAIIYLRSNSTVCKTRIVKRGRDGEEAIDCKLLDDIAAAHDTQLIDVWRDQDKRPLVIIECTDKTPSQILREIYTLLYPDIPELTQGIPESLTTV